MEIAVSTTLYKEQLAEFRERGYSILPGLADPSVPELFRDLKLASEIANDADLEVRTKLDFFQAVFQNTER